MFILSVLDGVMTLIWVLTGHAAESNPVMDYLIWLHLPLYLGYRHRKVQQRHTYLGKFLDILDVGDSDASRMRSQDDAGGDVTQDHRLAKALKQQPAAESTTMSRMMSVAITVRLSAFSLRFSKFNHAHFQIS